MPWIQTENTQENNKSIGLLDACIHYLEPVPFLLSIQLLKISRFGMKKSIINTAQVDLLSFYPDIWIDVAIFWIVRNFCWTYYLYFKSVIEPKRSFIYSTNQGGISSDANYAKQNIKCLNLSGSWKDRCMRMKYANSIKTRYRILARKH